MSFVRFTFSCNNYRCDQPPRISYNFIHELNDDLKCMICLDVAENPLQHELCGKLVCKECVEKLEKDKPCPHCRTQESAFFTDNKSKLFESSAAHLACRGHIIF